MVDRFYQVNIFTNLPQLLLLNKNTDINQRCKGYQYTQISGRVETKDAHLLYFEVVLKY